VKVYLFYIAIGLIIGWYCGKYGHKIERNLARKLLKHAWRTKKYVPGAGTDEEMQEYFNSMNSRSLAEYIYEHLMLDVLDYFGDEFGTIKWDTPLENLSDIDISTYIRDWTELHYKVSQ